ncbi:hypothetical protein QTH97_30315 [Variovorax sp. J22R24]|uniref:hypothetical protein n=1 Tax=Variovorax gracilis TaxID=3053502 RepID=UPI0025754C9E|nr:hypothetical protein [Variovorax sp. J22R24]MDM0109267.1 hypothetical protein [Variovorax sp. J22R24]
MSALGSCIQWLGLVKEAPARERTLRIAKRSIASINEMVAELLEYTRTSWAAGSM